MKILTVTGIKFEELPIADNCFLNDCQLMVCGYGVLGNLDLIEELKGNTNVIRAIAKVSADSKTVAVAGINATLYQRIYRSAIVIDNGKILGISDMVHTLEIGFDSGRSLRVYDTSLGKFGVLVGDDIMFPECARALRLQGAEMIFHITPKKSYSQQIAVSANALFNGIPILTVSRNDTMAYNLNGEPTAHLKGVEAYATTAKTSDLLIKNLKPEIYVNVFTED